MFTKPMHECLDQDTLFIGIGSILNHRIPALPEKKIVFGSGVGYGNLPNITRAWRIIGVRGPRTAAVLHLPEDKILTDPGVLIREFFPPVETDAGHISFMPHHRTDLYGNWKPVCEAAGIQYLAPSDPVSKTIIRIQKSAFVIAEAMHAAIIADALRVPWIPVCTSPYILKFKWLDWCESLGMDIDFEILQIPPEAKKLLERFPDNMTRRFNLPLESVATNLEYISKKGEKQLSSEKTFNMTYQKILDRFNEFNNKICAGT